MVGYGTVEGLGCEDYSVLEGVSWSDGLVVCCMVEWESAAADVVEEEISHAAYVETDTDWDGYMLQASCETRRLGGLLTEE